MKYGEILYITGLTGLLLGSLLLLVQQCFADSWASVFLHAFRGHQKYLDTNISFPSYPDYLYQRTASGKNVTGILRDPLQPEAQENQFRFKLPRDEHRSYQLKSDPQGYSLVSGVLQDEREALPRIDKILVSNHGQPAILQPEPAILQPEPGSTALRLVLCDQLLPLDLHDLANWLGLKPDAVSGYEIYYGFGGTLVVVVTLTNQQKIIITFEELLTRQGEWFYERVYLPLRYLFEWGAGCQSGMPYTRPTVIRLPRKWVSNSTEPEAVDGQASSRPGQTPPDTDDDTDDADTKKLVGRSEQKANDYSGHRENKMKNNGGVAQSPAPKAGQVRMWIIRGIADLADKKEVLHKGGKQLAKIITGHKAGFAFNERFNAHAGVHEGDSLQRQLTGVLQHGGLVALSSFLMDTIPLTVLVHFKDFLDELFAQVSLSQISLPGKQRILSPGEDVPEAPLVAAIEAALQQQVIMAPGETAQVDKPHVQAQISAGWQLILAHGDWHQVVYHSSRQKKILSAAEGATGVLLHEKLADDVHAALVYLTASEAQAEALEHIIMHAVPADLHTQLQQWLLSQPRYAGPLEQHLGLAPLVRFSDVAGLMPGNIAISPCYYIMIILGDADAVSPVVHIRIVAEIPGVTVTRPDRVSVPLNIFLGIRQNYQYQLAEKKLVVLPPVVTYTPGTVSLKVPSVQQQQQWFAERLAREQHQYEEEIRRRNRNLGNYRQAMDVRIAQGEESLASLKNAARELQLALQLLTTKWRKIIDFKLDTDLIEELYGHARKDLTEFVRAMHKAMHTAVLTEDAGEEPFPEGQDIVRQFRTLVGDICRILEEAWVLETQMGILSGKALLEQLAVLEQQAVEVGERIRQSHHPLPSARRASRAREPQAMSDAQYDLSELLKGFYYLLNSGFLLVKSVIEDRVEPEGSVPYADEEEETEGTITELPHIDSMLETLPFVREASLNEQATREEKGACD